MLIENKKYDNLIENFGLKELPEIISDIPKQIEKLLIMPESDLKDYHNKVMTRFNNKQNIKEIKETKMLKASKVIVGKDVYTIECNGEMPLSDALGCIYPPASQIRLRLVSPLNIKIPTRQVYKTLMHEIIHAIDKQTFTTCNLKVIDDNDMMIDDTEVAIELLANYVINHLERFIDNAIEFEELVMYCQSLELPLVRLQLFYDLLITVFAQNQELFMEFFETFNE